MNHWRAPERQVCIYWSVNRGCLRFASLVYDCSFEQLKVVPNSVGICDLEEDKEGWQGHGDLVAIHFDSDHDTDEQSLSSSSAPDSDADAVVAE